MRKKHKRPFTLLELMIAMGLVTLLISILGFSYRQITEVNRLMDLKMEEAFEKRYAEMRLGKVLPSIKEGTFFRTGASLPFEKEDTKNIFFEFDNCFKYDSTLSGLVVGRLFLDKKGRLLLALLPGSDRWDEEASLKAHFEVLLDEVDTLSWEFYVPPKKRSKYGLADLPDEAWGKWHDTWNYNVLPALVRLRMKRKGEETTFAYPLPESELHVVYNE